ncbi:hypothetical protein CONPUDRAFT_159027 [Coniophora puteana RWD-64-598 SS2]|uniref:Uncharacterized protein n=1 Tax=Coniophora puteana (strain RWD-64-598) TaxID=741705 RepID=A0A5M3M9P0_CONPW|nr:uncharacterized protein CONPUDRAFT_159027 [Coniophora puteana RWD-64-598 SS2]EIW75574.1 hypothetical protein CONPUDRAFT_159027 [Coniophora puteana RWD-64-598 SS2]
MADCPDPVVHFDFHVFIKYKAESNIFVLGQKDFVQTVIQDIQALRSALPKRDSIIYAHAYTPLCVPWTVPFGYLQETTLVHKWAKIANRTDDGIEELWNDLEIEKIALRRCPPGSRLKPPSSLGIGTTTPQTVPRNYTASGSPPQKAPSPFTKSNVAVVTTDSTPVPPSQTRTAPAFALPRKPAAFTGQVQFSSALRTARSLASSQTGTGPVSAPPAMASQAAQPLQAVGTLPLTSTQARPPSYARSAPVSAPPPGAKPVVQPQAVVSSTLPTTKAPPPPQGRAAPVSSPAAAKVSAPTTRVGDLDVSSLLPAASTTTASSAVSRGPNVPAAPASNPAAIPIANGSGANTPATAAALSSADQEKVRVLTILLAEAQAKMKDAHHHAHLHKSRLKHLGAWKPEAEDSRTTAELVMELNDAKAALQVERRRRLQVEKQLEKANLERESQALMFPVLLEAFKEISTLADAVADAPMET